MSQGAILQSLIFTWSRHNGCLFSVLFVCFILIFVFFHSCPREVVIDFCVWLVYCPRIIERDRFWEITLRPQSANSQMSTFPYQSLPWRCWCRDKKIQRWIWTLPCVLCWNAVYGDHCWGLNRSHCCYWPEQTIFCWRRLLKNVNADESATPINASRFLRICWDELKIVLVF